MRVLVSPLFLLILYSVGAGAVELNHTAALVPYQAIYTAKLNGMPVQAQRKLIKEDQGYRLVTSAQNLLGNMNETELFHLDTQGRIRIDDYVSKRSIFGSKRIERLAIDHQNNKATYTRKKKKRETILLPEYLGPVSYQLQLSRDLGKPDATLNYFVISHGKIKQYKFKQIGEELITTGLGEVTALKVRRVREKKNRETVFWMAPDWNYLPVKIKQIESDGETYVMTLKSVTINGKAIAEKL